MAGAFAPAINCRTGSQQLCLSVTASATVRTTASAMEPTASAVKPSDGTMSGESMSGEAASREAASGKATAGKTTSAVEAMSVAPASTTPTPTASPSPAAPTTPAPGSPSPTVPGTGADKDSVRKPRRPVIAVRRASVRIVAVIAIRAAGRSVSYPDAHCNLRL